MKLVRGVVFFAMAMLIIVASSQQTDQAATEPPSTTQPSASPSPRAMTMGIFKGTLSCADCLGILTELTIVRIHTGRDEGTFLLKETFTGKKARTVEQTGVWTAETQETDGQKSLLIEMHFENGEKRYFLQTNTFTLLQLSEDKKKLEPQSAHQLTTTY